MAFETKEYEHKRAKGLKRDPIKHQALKATSPRLRVVLGGGPIPGKLNLASKVSPPEDQGSCGSCWDFAITKALRSAHMLAGKDPGRLSFNYLLNNCSGVPQAAYDGCGGGDFPAGLGMLNGKGPWLYDQDPYTGREGVCKTGLKVAATARHWVLVGDGIKPPSFQELAAAMASGNSGKGNILVVDVDAGSGSWESYSGGIYDQNAGNSIDHMVNIVGYDMETSVDEHGNAKFDAHGMPVNGDGYLIVMNNWGNNWGENGYMRTRWGMNAIAETAMFFDVEAPVPPTPPTPPVPPVPPVPPTPPQPSPWCKCFPYWKHIAVGLGIGVALAGAISIGVQVGKNLKK